MWHSSGQQFASNGSRRGKAAAGSSSSSSSGWRRRAVAVGGGGVAGGAAALPLYGSAVKRSDHSRVKCYHGSESDTTATAQSSFIVFLALEDRAIKVQWHTGVCRPALMPSVA